MMLLRIFGVLVRWVFVGLMIVGVFSVRLVACFLLGGERLSGRLMAGWSS